MTIQEKRWMDMDNLRALCIRHGWFTRGDCKAYDKFLNMPYDAKGTQRNITTMRRSIPSVRCASRKAG